MAILSRSAKYFIFGIIASLLGLGYNPVPKASARAWSQELLTNGGFEASTHMTPWYEYQDGVQCSGCIITNAAGAYAGSYYAKLGKTGSTTDTLAYPAAPPTGRIALPANATKIYLSWYYKIITTESDNSDSIIFYSLDPTNLHMGPLILYLSHDNDVHSWTTGGIDISFLKGKSFMFYFTVANGTHSDKPTYLYLDNLSLTVYYNDTVRPNGSIKINNGKKSTTKSKVTLKLSATDNLSGVTKMRISNNGKKWTGWINYKTSYKNWRLTYRKYGGTKKKGMKKVYVQFKDGAGNVSKKKFDSIRYR